MCPSFPTINNTVSLCQVRGFLHPSTGVAGTSRVDTLWINQTNDNLGCELHSQAVPHVGIQWNLLSIFWTWPASFSLRSKCVHIYTLYIYILIYTVYIYHILYGQSLCPTAYQKSMTHKCCSPCHVLRQRVRDEKPSVKIKFKWSQFIPSNRCHLLADWWFQLNWQVFVSGVNHPK